MDSKKSDQEVCMHRGAKKVIFIYGSHYCGTTRTLDVNTCDDCGAIYLRRYRHWTPQAEEIIDIIMPGETEDGLTFYKGAADLIKQVRDASNVWELKAIQRQATAVRDYALERLEQLEEVAECASTSNT